MLLVSCNACNIRINSSVSSFSHTGKITTFRTLKTNSTNWNICDQLRWIPLTLFRKSVCCYFNSICMLPYGENKSGSRVNELRYRTFAKKNLSVDHFPPTLVLYLCRTLIFFHQYLFNTFSQLFLRLSKISKKVSLSVSFRIL